MATITKEKWLIVAIVLSLLASGFSAVRELTRESDSNHAAGSTNDPERIAHLEQQLEAVLDRLDALDHRGASDHKTKTTQPNTVSNPLATGLILNGQIAKLEEAVVDRVESNLGSRLEVKRPRNKRGEWEAPIGELAEALSLNEEQTDATEEIFDEGRDNFLELMQSTREDGGSLAGDFADDLISGTPPEEATKAWVKRMLEENIPGSDKSYLSQIITMRKEIETSLSEELSEEQMKLLKSLRIDPLQVNTGYDPFRAYIETKFRE